jgi:hypothetical protein
MDPERRDELAHLGLLVQGIAAEYHLRKRWTSDPDAADAERTPLFDAMHRDGMRALMRRAVARGLVR